MPAQTCSRALAQPSLPAARPAPAPAPAPPAAPCEALRLLQEDDLPLDPRWWNRAEVGRWVAARGGHPERFPMNGKALCLMTSRMFAARVPERGPALHQEFRRRLAKAITLQEFFEKMSSK